MEDREKKVILFIDSLVSGGAQRQILLLARELVASKYKPQVLIYNENYELLNFIKDLNIPVTLVKKKSKLPVVFLYKLFVFFKKEQPDILLSYLHMPTVLSRVVGRLAGVRTIITSERNLDINHSLKTLLLEKMLNSCSTAIVANAYSIKDLLVEKVKIDPIRISVIYNGVDTRMYSILNVNDRESARQKFGFTSDDVVITLPGRIVLQKNHLCLVKAIGLLNGTADNIRVLFVGNEIDLNVKQELVDDISRNDMCDKYTFAGQQTNMNEIYGLSDIVVLPSLWEGLPNVAIEAMACGRVVIASDIADNKQLIEDKYSGYLFSNDNHKALSETIALCLKQSADDLNNMGLRAKDRVDELCSLNKFKKSYIALFDSLTGMQRGK